MKTTWLVWTGMVVGTVVALSVTLACSAKPSESEPGESNSSGAVTLEGIPPETYEYRLGNRSALEWVIDQYQVSTDKRSGIANDPNRPEDPQYIVRLIAQVITVSLETVRIVKALPLLQTDQDHE